MQNITQDIGPILTALILIVGSITLYRNYLKDRKEIERSTREAFLNRQAWTNEGDTNSEDSVFFSMNIDNQSNYVFSGSLDLVNKDVGTDKLTFYFKESKGKVISLDIMTTNGYREFNFTEAELTMINPDLFEISFLKSSNTDEIYLNLPRKTQIFPNESHTNIDSGTNNSIKGTHSSNILTNEIIDAISPERNYAKVEELLGIPDKTVNDFSVFEDIIEHSEETGNIKSDIYFLDNVALKVTTLDGKVIYSLTVIGCDSELMIPEVFYPCDTYKSTLDQYRICSQIIEQASNIVPVTTIRDSATAIQTSIGPPFYKYLTYFTYGALELENPNYNELLGSEIIGFCLAQGDMAFYIYDYEMR